MPDFRFVHRQRIRARGRRVLGSNTGDASGHLGLSCIPLMTVRKQQGLRPEHRHERDDLQDSK